MEPAPPPSRRLLWLWAAFRAAWIAVLPLFVGGLLLAGGVYEARHGRWSAALTTGGFGLIGLVLSWFAARHTWKVFSGARPATETALTGEIISSGVVLAALILLYLIVSPYFSGLFRKSHEGAMKNRLLDLRQRVAVHRAAHGGLAPADLDDLGEIPPLWGRYTEIPHPGKAAALVVDGAATADTGKWAYVISLSSPSLTGGVFIDCTHTDTKGSVWSSY